MFEKGKRYKIKTLKELLIVPDTIISAYSISMSGQQAFILGRMDKHCGEVLVCTKSDVSYISFGNWSWSPWMVDEVKDTKRILLNAIKDFK